MSLRSRWRRMPEDVHEFQLRVPDDLFDQVRTSAARHRRSINREIEWALYRYIAAQQIKQPPASPTAAAATRAHDDAMIGGL